MSYGKFLAMSAAVAITGIGLFLLAPPASGKAPPVNGTAPPTDVVTEQISYADLNLASAADERTFTSRVSAAVSELCKQVTGGDSGAIEYSFNIHQCSSLAWAQLRPQMALAKQRAREIASTGHSSISASALKITIRQ